VQLLGDAERTATATYLTAHSYGFTCACGQVVHLEHRSGAASCKNCGRTWVVCGVKASR